MCLYLLSNYVVIYLTYQSINNKKDVVLFYRYIIYVCVLFCFYGIINKVYGENVYYNYLSNYFNFFDFANYYQRFRIERTRVSSFAYHPIFYGFLLVVFFHITLYYYNITRNRIVFSTLLSISMVLILINIIFSNTRTIILILFISFIVFFILNFKIVKYLKIFLFSIVIMSPLLIFAPDLFSKLYSSDSVITRTTNIFITGGNDVEGSSINMRLVQLYGAISEFNKNPIWGNGLNYISKDLGYDSGERKSAKIFFGFESYIFRLLIEFGLVGILLNIILFYYLFKIFFKYRKAYPDECHLATLNINIIVVFLIFSSLTGAMNSIIITFCLLGVGLKYFDLLRLPNTDNK